MNRFEKARLALSWGLSAILAGLIWQAFPAFSQDPNGIPLTTLLRCTREEPIIKALQLLKDSEAGEASLTTILNKPVRIVFKDMKSVHKALKNYDALSWLSHQGQQVIFINEKHRNAPPEALAAVIAHEAMHDDPYNSLNEEVESWQVEARVWEELKVRNLKLSQIPMGQNALVDRENKIEQKHHQGELTSFVRSMPGYQGLQETSPGFGPTIISTEDTNPAF